MMTHARSVGIIGGGLAGLAAASALCERGFRVELFEAKQQLGGRAGSFVDPQTGELVDHCQHVAMGCCTEFLAFIRRTGIEHLFRRDQVLHFLSPTGQQLDLRASRWLPAPLHLLPSLAKLDYLSWSEKIGIGRAMLALVRYSQGETEASLKMGDWLRERGQSQRAIERFWQVLLVSALGEALERASVAAARKVFVDGFLASRRSYHLLVPQAPLAEIYEHGVAHWLRERGVQMHLSTPVIVGRRSAAASPTSLILPSGESHEFDYLIVATAWNALTSVLSPADFPELAALFDFAAALTSSPITSLHLWFDRPITSLPHAILIDHLTQWVFSRPTLRGGQPRATPASQVTSSPMPVDHGVLDLHYYQVVVSASHELAGRERDDVLREVLTDLADAFPAAREAQLTSWRMLTQPAAVFSYRPGLDAVRPAQRTPIENLFLAGDYTATGWPATMESAIRSGHAAAEAVAAS